MKLATALIEAEEPSSVKLLPLRVTVVSHRFSVRETVLATMSSNSCPPVRSRLQLLNRRNPLLQNHLLFLERFHLQLDLFQLRFFRAQLRDAARFRRSTASAR